MNPRQSVSYLICATPRTGSNFLCEVLSSLGTAGHPEEYFWNRRFWYDHWKINDFVLSSIGCVWRAPPQTTSLARKLMWHQLKGLVGDLTASDESPARVLEAAFPNLHHLWLRRADRIRQGISYYRALETRRWRSTDVATSRQSRPSISRRLPA